MGRDITRLDLPIKSAVRQEVQQFATGNIILGIHQIEITMDGIYDDAVWHADLCHLRCIGQRGTDYLMGTHVDDAISDGVLHRHLTPLTTIEIEGVAHDAEVADGLLQTTAYRHPAVCILHQPVDS